MSKLVKWRPLMSGFLPSRILTYEKLPRWRKCHRYLKEKTVSASCFFCWRGTLLKSQLAFFQHPPFSSMFKRVFGGNRIGRLCSTEGIGGMEPRSFPVEVFFFLRYFTNIPVEHPEVFDTNMLGQSYWSDPKTSSYHIVAIHQKVLLLFFPLELLGNLEKTGVGHFASIFLPVTQ